MFGQRRCDPAPIQRSDGPSKTKHHMHKQTQTSLFSFLQHIKHVDQKASGSQRKQKLGIPENPRSAKQCRNHRSGRRTGKSHLGLVIATLQLRNKEKKNETETK
jgi:hypothetical protein